MSALPKLSIGEIIRNAIVFNPRNWQRGAVNTDTLLQDVERLFDLLNERKIEYVLVGGIAVLQYVEGRNTQDVDLIMALSSLKKLPEIRLQSQDLHFARGMFGQLQIDVLLTRNRLFDKVRRNYTTIQPFFERDIPTATVEGLLLLKLYALPSLYRQGNMDRVGLYKNDIAMLMRNYPVALAPLWKELASHVNDTDLAELKEEVADLTRPPRRFRPAPDSDQVSED